MDLSSFLGEWNEVPASTIAHHGRECCDRALAWFESMDAAGRGEAPDSIPPLWLGQQYAWGPHAWPIHWCEAAAADHLDCGALAAVAAHLMQRRGCAVVRVQLVEMFSSQNVDCWSALWQRADLPCEWAANDIVYHEAVGLVDSETLRIWDPTDARWLDPDEPRVYGSAHAIRITSEGDMPCKVRWGNNTVATGEWFVLHPQTRSGAIAAATRRIARMMREIRAQHPWDAAEDSEGGYFPVPVAVEGRPVEMPLAWLGTTGCSWARQGGCTVCDYGGYDGEVPSEQLVAQARKLLSEFDGQPAIQLSALGSFFDDKELPADVRVSILTAVSAHPSIRMLAVEARADQISRAKVRDAVEMLSPHCRLEIGLGLESADDGVRNLCINKGLLLTTYERAVDDIARAGASHLAHVLLKPPFLTEAEAVDDAVRTIQYAATFEPSSIVLMAANVKSGTLLGELHLLGKYRAPWLWSVLEVLSRVDAQVRDRVLVYGFRCGMPMLETGHNCPSCTPTVRELIDRFDADRDWGHIEAAMAIECGCKEDWLADMARGDTRPLIDRVNSFCDEWENTHAADQNGDPQPHCGAPR